MIHLWRFQIPTGLGVRAAEVLRLRFTDAQGLALGLVRAAPKAPRRLCLEVPRPCWAGRFLTKDMACTWLAHGLHISVVQVLQAGSTRGPCQAPGALEKL